MKWVETARNMLRKQSAVVRGLGTARIREPRRPVRGRLSNLPPVRGWMQFWFAPLDPASLSVARILVGGMMIYSHFVWGLNLEGFFGPHGWQSTEAVREFFAEEWLPSIWWYVPVDQLRLVHLLCFIPLVMFFLGIATPASSVLALAVTISNSNRAPLANYGMDQILTMLGLYLVIGGSGDRFSVDAWWRQRRARRRDAESRPPRKTSRARLATRLIQVHLCIIYFFAGVSKLQGDAWWSGDAIWMAFANQEYQSLDMTWLASYPWILEIATHVTVLWELSFAFVIWNRALRPFLLPIGLAMHAGIGLCMGMITFGLIMMFGYLAFVPPEWITRVAGRVRSRVRSRAGGVDASSVARRRKSSTADFDVARPVRPAPALRPAPVANARSSELSGQPAGLSPNESVTIGFCDPGWHNRAFALYLGRRGIQPFMTGSPQRLWRHLEEQELPAAILFVDPLATEEFALLLDDLTLAPVSGIPMVVASARPSRLDRAVRTGARIRPVALPAKFRDIRAAVEAVLPGFGNPPAVPTVDTRPEAAANGVPVSETLTDEFTTTHTFDLSSR